MAFRFTFAADDGVIYGVTTSGELLWYRHLDRAGATEWANGGSARRVGVGWANCNHVVAGTDGEIYAIDANGTMLWYRHLSRDGAFTWANGGMGQPIGNGWQEFLHVCAGDDGSLYGVTASGQLLWYRHLQQSGAFEWAASGAGELLGEGWNQYARVMAGSDGVIYAITHAGELLWFRHLSRQGLAQWRYDAPRTIGSGWQSFRHVFSGRNGILYGVTQDGNLQWYRHLDRDGEPRWANQGTGIQIGIGWADVNAPIEGYAKPLSAGPNERIEFCTSTATSHYTVTYYRLHSGNDGIPAVPFAGPFTRPGTLHAIPTNVSQTGCGWPTAFDLAPTTGWPSGLYSAHCEDSEGGKFDIVFVIKPAPSARNQIAVLANTNTWNAYNSYGGFSQYTKPNSTVLSFERPNPAIAPFGTGLDHLARAESWVLGWMEQAGYALDVYTDLDFHNGIADLNHYKALVLNTHPEYWTLQMFDRLEAYLAQGGRLLYLGGNGLYERVNFIDNARRLLLRDNGLNQRDLFRSLTPARPERPIIGVAYEGDNWSGDKTLYRPYEVRLASHRFFTGTGLSNGNLIGATGRNGAASGWEMDISAVLPGKVAGPAPSNLQILARGTNTGPVNNEGAEMTYYDTPAGGFVFSVGSLTFGGSLAVDAQLQKIVRNVLDECLAS